MTLDWYMTEKVFEEAKFKEMVEIKLKKESLATPVSSFEWKNCDV